VDRARREPASRRLALIVVLASACGGERGGEAPSDPVALEAIEQDLIEHTIPGIDGATVVARCADDVVTAADIALWLELFPALTTRQAVDDLLDLCVVRASWDPDRVEEWTPLADHARRVGLAMAWYRANVLLDTSLLPTPEAVAAFVAEPGYTTFFGLPELRTVSHMVLLLTEESSQDAVATATDVAARIAADLDAIGPGRSVSDLARLVERERSTLTDAGLEPRLEVRFSLPRRYAGAQQWEGLEASVDAFADAVFATPEGGAFGPVRTEFGIHVGIVERILPEDLPPMAQREARAHDRLLSQARATAFSVRLRAVYDAARVGTDPEAVNLLSRSAMERMAEAGEQRSR
jgi:hypothetical protein